jgi:hypothetical protein
LIFTVNFFSSLQNQLLINALSAIKEKERERGEQQKQEREKEREANEKVRHFKSFQQFYASGFNNNKIFIY